MDIDIDHYDVLGLPSGVEGPKLTKKEISKAYKLKALELHPDKRPDDPNAHTNFQKLKTSYEILKDEKTRKLFDDLLRVKCGKVRRQSQQDSKQRKMMSDLDKRERAAFEVDPSVRAREDEDRIARKLQKQIARICFMFTKKTPAETAASKNASTTKRGGNKDGESSLNEEKIRKVSWEKIGEDYTSQRLKGPFEKFGVVEDVVIKNSKKKGSALIEMGSKDAAEAATWNAFGDLPNPLLIMPLQLVQSTTPFSSSASKDAKPDGTKLSNIVGAGYQAFERSVLEKLKKLKKDAEKQKSTS